MAGRAGQHTLRRVARGLSRSGDQNAHSETRLRRGADEIRHRADEGPAYHNTFDDPATLRDWRLEGGRSMRIAGGRLVLENPPDGNSSSVSGGHLTCWLTPEMPANFLLEFSFRPRNRREGLAIVFFNARSLGGKSIFEPSLAPRDGTFVQYHTGDLNNYHISYWAGARDSAHVRKNRGFHLVATGEDLILTGAPDAFQTIRIYKRGGTIRLMVDGIIASLTMMTGRNSAPDGRTPAGSACDKWGTPAAGNMST